LPRPLPSHESAARECNAAQLVVQGSPGSSILGWVCSKSLEGYEREARLENLRTRNARRFESNCDQSTSVAGSVDRLLAHVILRHRHRPTLAWFTRAGPQAHALHGDRSGRHRQVRCAGLESGLQSRRSC